MRLTETLAVEGRALGIRVYAVAPGAIDTAMLNEVVAAGPAAGDEREEAIRRRARGGDSTTPIEELIVYLGSGGDGGFLSGKLIAAQHDDWQELASRGEGIIDSDWNALRRIDRVTLSRLRPPDEEGPQPAS